jgi:taurine dioxygenase
MANPQTSPRTPTGGYTISVTPLSPTLAADIDAGDLRELTDLRFAQIRRAWLEHHVLRFRDQDFANADIMAFGRRFGEFQPNIVERGRDSAYPQVSFISNLVAKDRPLGMLGDGELVWHTDQSSFEVVPSATILFAVEVPVGQGYTEFLNAHAAFDALPRDLARRLEGLSLKHDNTYDSAGERRPGHGDVVDVTASPGAIHPLVITHPETGGKALYLGRRPYAYIVGLPVAESEALLDDIWARTMRPEFVWRQEWRPGDVLVWDNRSVLHRRTPFDSKARRMLRRVCITGGHPRFDPGAARPAPSH